MEILDLRLMWVSQFVRIAHPLTGVLKILAVMVPLLGAACLPAGAQTTAAIVDIDTTSTLPIAPGFSGVSDDLVFPVEYWDYRFNSLAAQIGYGWVRFPGGNTSDIYNWQTGQQVPDWLTQFGNNQPNGTQASIAQVAGRGGAKLIDAANRASLFGATLIVCANGFTDTPQSIGQLADYVKTNHISVAAWELSNEPYLYPQIFADATAYLDKMKSYRDAIKAVDPNAMIAIFARDPGNSAVQNTWDTALAAYPSKYWDAITFHHYPPQSSGNFAQWMADENAVLVNKTTTVVMNQLAPIGPPGVKFLNTEFDSTIGTNSTSGAASITDGTLWGGVYAAEYTMRMSTLPSMLHVGPNEIVRYAGVFPTKGHEPDAIAAANAGQPIDTVSLDFGFYIGAQAYGQAVLNGVINRATQSDKTMVTGGAIVPATGVAQGIPALYAMSYTSATGGLSVVITNKSAIPHQVTIRMNGAAAAGTFPVQFVTGTDPSAANTAASPNAVTIQTGSSGNPVTVPPYSVLRADITTPPIATFVNSASLQPGPLAPQQLVTAYGMGFASQSITAPSQSLPIVLGDTNISITDSGGAVRAALLLSVSPREASFQLPAGVAMGAATVKVMRSGTTVLTGQLEIGAVSPGIYSANGNGAGVAAASALRIRRWWIEPMSVFFCEPGIPLSCLSTPLAMGGNTDPLLVSFAGTGIRGAGSVQAYVAGQPVPVLYFGPQNQYAGLDEVVVWLPPSLAATGEASVYLMADGKASNMTTVNIR